MAEISPLRGVRFNRSRSGPIGPLLAPPYDVAKGLDHGAQHSISRIENVDVGVAGDQHAQAAIQYREWLTSGVLALDPAPAVYVHRHQFSIKGERVLRTGLIARVRLEEWSKRIILPHERTYPGPRSERRARLQAVEANLSPLYFLFRDSLGEMQELLERYGPDSSPVPELDRMGGAHSLESIATPEFHEALAGFFATRSLFVADGHHRYEAALEYRDAQRKKHPGRDGPWEYVLALMAAAEDPGVQVRPTHRLIRTAESLSSLPIVEVLNRWFSVGRIDVASREEIESALFRLVVPGDGEDFIFSALPGDPHRKLMPQARGAAWRSMAVSAVESALQSHVGSHSAPDGRYVAPIVDEQLAIRSVKDGAAAAALLLPAPSLDQLLAVAEQGDLLPPKSTWFEPKAPAGLVINDLRISEPD